MEPDVIYSDDYLKIYNMPDGIYIETYKKGFPLDQLNNIFSSHPEIGVTSYNTLRNAINSAPSKPQKFAEQKERIAVELSHDDLAAFVTFNLSKEELDISHREVLSKEILDALNEKGVIFGIKSELFTGDLQSGKQYLAAEGVPAVNGTDSIIKMYDLQDLSPEVREDGKVDFYELKLINRVKVDDWLGERIEATEGTAGKSVKGTLLKPIKGKTDPLLYDKNTVKEIFSSGKTTLLSRINGAVCYTNGIIGVSNHLEIKGDVDLSTGNIKFDGYLTIKGTVMDGFSIEATKDIEISGDLGLGNVKSISSTCGSIFIKGGIASKGRAEIYAARNVYAKFVDNVAIYSGGATHIGYYCKNSLINAKEVILDSSNGKIIGGHIKAEVKVMAPIIGSEIEKKTVIEVMGFNRQEYVEKLEMLLQRVNELRSEQQSLKVLISGFKENSQMDSYKRKQYSDALERIFFIKEEIRNLEEDRKNITAYLKTRGEGEISVSKKIYPNCTLIINSRSVEISSQTPSTTYFLADGIIKQI